MLAGAPWTRLAKLNSGRSPAAAAIFHGVKTWPKALALEAVDEHTLSPRDWVRIGTFLEH